MAISSTSVSSFAASNITTTVNNITITLADTEQSFALPGASKGFILRSRNYKDMRLAFNSGETATDYLSIPGGASYEDDKQRGAQTLYFRSTLTNDIVELVVFT